MHILRNVYQLQEEFKLFCCVIQSSGAFLEDITLREEICDESSDGTGSVIAVPFGFRLIVDTEFTGICVELDEHRHSVDHFFGPVEQRPSARIQAGR